MAGDPLSRFAVSVVLAVALAGLACAPRGGDSPMPLTIVADAGPFGTLERAAAAESLVRWRDADPADDAACTGAFAALELRHFLAQALGVAEDSIRLDPAATLPTRGTAIVLVSDPRDPRLAALDTAGVPPLGAERDAFRVFTRGRGARRVHVIQGRSRTGTLYGAYALLDTLGVRFHRPGDIGTIVPTGVRLPATLRFASAPAYDTRGFWAWEPRGTPELFLWMARNRMNLWTAEDGAHVPLLRKLGIGLTQGGHHVQKRFLDPARDFAAHPEWYAEIGGRRSPDIRFDAGDNFCTSNAEAVRTLGANLVADLAQGAWREADVVMLWMLDNGRWCQCANCAAQGTPTDRMLAVTDAVAAAVADARRDGRLGHPVTLMPLAFLETMAPPTRAPGPSAATRDVVMNWFPIDRCYAHALADPSCPEINAGRRAEFDAWATAPDRAWRGGLCVGEYYNIASFKSLPVIRPHVIGADVAWFHAHGVRHFHTMHVPVRNWGPMALDHAVLARALWNPAVATDSVIADYLRRSYPRSCEAMGRFHAALEIATANMKLLKDRVRVGRVMVQLHEQLARGGYPLPLEHMPFAPTGRPRNRAPALTEIAAATTAARAALDEALALAPDGDEHARLLEDARRFAYAETTLQFYDHLVRLRLLEMSRETGAARREWAELAATVARLEGMKDVARDASSHANAGDAYEATGMADVVEGMARRYARR